MMPESLFLAFALVFVIEGILPFLSPSLWRHTLHILSEQSDKAVRIMGLISMLIGVALLYGVRLYFAGELNNG